MERVFRQFCYNEYMEQDILGEVIEAEREIVRCLDQEKAKARERIEGVKLKTGADIAAAEEELRGAFERAVAEAERASAISAGEIEKTAEERAARIRALDDAVLKGIARKYINKVLPG